ncbi:MAG: hypothetical protein GX359_07565 [Clostridiales bacterium]|nr:hypothetical protein [Clostridiales bacterium]
MEALVFLIEAAVYSILLYRYSKVEKTKRWHAPIYALFANVASFVAGLWMAYIMPGYF